MRRSVGIAFAVMAACTKRVDVVALVHPLGDCGLSSVSGPNVVPASEAVGIEITYSNYAPFEARCYVSYGVYAEASPTQALISSADEHTVDVGTSGTTTVVVNDDPAIFEPGGRYRLHACAYAVGAAEDRRFDEGGDENEANRCRDFEFEVGLSPGAPMLLAPTNGATTGSQWVPADAPVVDHPLRPRFRWPPVANAVSYELELTSECATEGFQACAFTSATRAVGITGQEYRPATPLPVALTAPVGRRYFWRVRACVSTDECWGWSKVRYLDVGRDAKDFNGDGYADVVVGATQQNNREGSVYLYFGGATTAAGPSNMPDLALDNPARLAGGEFGDSVASAGDVNADGYADLIVGAPFWTHNESAAGSAYLYFGTAAGPSSGPTLTLDNPADQAGGQFGTSVASAGDVNGDGYADLIVGANYQDNPELDEGSAYVYFGSSAGPSGTPDLALDNPADQAIGFFGRPVASAGDVNGDGYADVIVGAHAQDNPESDEGSAYVYLGSATGPSSTPDVTLDNPTGQPIGFFGSVASAGDVNGDGYADVIVGANRQNNPALYEGSAYVYLGSAAGVSSTPDVTLDNPTDQRFALFGDSVASAGDVNGDGYADVIIGAHGQQNPGLGDGSAYVYFGRAAGLDVLPDITLDNPVDQMTEGSGQFGGAVASAGDVNGDGYADLIIGAPYVALPESVDGRAYLYIGSEAGPAITPDLALDNPLDQVSGAGYFGVSVAFAGDVNGEKHAVAAWAERASEVDDRGRSAGVLRRTSVVTTPCEFALA